MGVLRRTAALVVGTLGLVASSGLAVAHVKYVTDSNRTVRPVAFLVEVISEPANALLVAGTALVVLVAAAAYLWVQPVRRDVHVFRETVRGYEDLLPWILRLSLGLPLVGAGFAGYFFSPAVPQLVPGPAGPTRLFQIAVGFLLLFGLATRAAAFVGLVVYLVSAAFVPTLLLASEFVPGFLGLLLVGSGRPGADHVLHSIANAPGTVYSVIDPVNRLAVWFDGFVDPYQRWIPTVVRVGLGLNFAFLGLTQKLLQPGPALAVVEKYTLTRVVPVDPGMWVVGVGITEVAIGLALIVGVFTRAVSLLAFGMFTLTLFGLPGDPVLAHVSLFGLASALVITGSGPLGVDWYLGAEVSEPEPTRGETEPTD